MLQPKCNLTELILPFLLKQKSRLQGFGVGLKQIYGEYSENICENEKQQNNKSQRLKCINHCLNHDTKTSNFTNLDRKKTGQENRTMIS